MSRSNSSRTRSVLDRAADWMMDATVLERTGIAIGSTLLALLIGLVITTIAGYNPALLAQQMVFGAFGGMGSIARTLRFTTIFILAGVSVAIAFKAGVFNIGVQGQFIFGGFACVVSILWLAPLLPENSVSGAALVLLGSVVAIVVGGLYAALPGVLKAYGGANEIITTIMLNFIAIGVVGWLVQSPLRNEGSAAPNTERLPEHVGLPQIVFNDPNFSIVGLGITLVIVAIVAIIVTHTSMGYDMLVSGYQQSAATYSGVNAKHTIVATMTFSGMVAGLAGAIFVIMIQGYYTDPVGIGNYGFDAIAVSLLASNNPVGVIPAGLLFGGLESAGSHIQINSDVPVQLIDGIVGFVVFFVAAPELFRMMAKRIGLGGDER